MIKLSGVSKSYDIRLQRDDYSIKEGLVTAARRLSHEVRARIGFAKGAYRDPTEPIEGYGEHGPLRKVLNDIDLEIRQGETVALIGRNGCGKSTLLKVMAGIYQPDRGQVSIQGRISPLIELGAGFHPEFTGKENVYLNGQILGLSRQEIKKRYDEILEFAEIKDYIHYPVRTYSSGMFMRLAFSVAINVDPDILLVDEIIAVGDAGFQAKCHAKMDEFKEKGKTIVLVTHATQVVESWADRAVYLRDGRIVCDDTPRKAVRLYLEDLNINNQLNSRSLEHEFPLLPRELPAGQIGLNFVSFEQIAVATLDSFLYEESKGSLMVNIDMTELSKLRKIVGLRVRILTQDRSLLLAEVHQAFDASRLRVELGGLSGLADNQYALELAALIQGHAETTLARLGMVLDRGLSTVGLLTLPTRIIPIAGTP